MVGDRGGRLRPVLGNAIKDLTLSDLSCKHYCSHDAILLCIKFGVEQFFRVLEQVSVHLPMQVKKAIDCQLSEQT